MLVEVKNIIICIVYNSRTYPGFLPGGVNFNKNIFFKLSTLFNYLPLPYNLLTWSENVQNIYEHDMKNNYIRKIYDFFFLHFSEKNIQNFFIQNIICYTNLRISKTFYQSNVPYLPVFAWNIWGQSSWPRTESLLL